MLAELFAGMACHTKAIPPTFLGGNGPTNRCVAWFAGVARSY